MHLAYRSSRQESLHQHTVLGVSQLSNYSPWIPGYETRGSAPQRDESCRFKIRLANTEGRRSSASYLIQKMYSWRGYATTPLTGGDPNRMTLVASDDENVVATISVGLDSSSGLLVDELYGEEVNWLREAGNKVCEFTKLAVDRTQQSRELLAMLFHIAYIYARKMNGFSDLVIEVNPRHVKFYERMLGFQQLGPERTNLRVNAPAVLMRLQLCHPEQQIRLHGGKREAADDKRSLYPYFFAPHEEAGIVRRLLAMG